MNEHDRLDEADLAVDRVDLELRGDGLPRRLDDGGHRVARRDDRRAVGEGDRAGELRDEVAGVVLATPFVEAGKSSSSSATRPDGFVRVIP